MQLETRSLPANPNLTQIKKQAKDLKRLVAAGDDEAQARVAAFHPSIESSSEITDDFTLRDAQVTLAREYGFDGWHQLNTEVGRRMVEERDLHRWFGVQLNNGMWDRIEDEGFGPGSPLEDRERALYSAYAAAYHWRNVGTVANTARGEHLISRMAAKIGLGDLAVQHARRCLELVEGNPEAMETWDEPFAREALARGLAATGKADAARAERTRAIELTAVLDDEEDRQILEAELAREPWFGIGTSA